jgi:adenylate cyclase
VFRYGGTLDSYIGDAVMAVFGAPTANPRAAADAVACGRDMVETVVEWNGRRRERDLPPIRIGVGAHHGPIVLGDIGGERRLELTVIGDTVNVASRLESLTRTLGVDMVVSEALARQAIAQAGEAALAGFEAAPEQQLRGREGALSVRVWRRSD